MDYTLTLEKVKRALSEVQDVPFAVISPEHKLVQDLNLDSVSVVVLSIALEEEFKECLLLNEWVVAAEDHAQLTVKSLAEYIHSRFCETAT